MDDTSLYDDREDLRVYDEFEESGFMERHAYSDFVRACMDFAEHEVVPHGRFLEPLGDIALGRDFLVGKATKDDLAEHRARTWKHFLGLPEADRNIHQVTDFFVEYEFLTDSPSPEQQDPYDFLFFHWLMQVDCALPQAFMDYLRKVDAVA
ncbi:MAG: hypothetical protein Q4D85_12650 [Corynebacterium sp.]|uniref:hypothetical protein n=1 Tax=Corynebacterium sp. TaxID=1720 RepID=UPI0026DAA01F|nr:hypothetical protein [Corynebacterium sp.]MDO5099581.1 hypothetical protein [Corynebacterium sp.]